MLAATNTDTAAVSMGYSGQMTKLIEKDDWLVFYNAVGGRHTPCKFFSSDLLRGTYGLAI